jgi:hypothetical protein
MRHYVDLLLELITWRLRSVFYQHLKDPTSWKPHPYWLLICRNNSSTMASFGCKSDRKTCPQRRFTQFSYLSIRHRKAIRWFSSSGLSFGYTIYLLPSLSRKLNPWPSGIPIRGLHHKNIFWSFKKITLYCDLVIDLHHPGSAENKLTICISWRGLYGINGRVRNFW